MEPAAAQNDRASTRLQTAVHDDALVDLVRSRCYGFLSAVFLGQIEELQGEAWPQVVASVAELEALAGSSSPQSIAVPRDSAEAVATEFARLFYGVGDATVPMAASCYANELRLYCQQPFHDAKAFYARFGIARSEALGLPEDHVAIELAFMQELAYGAAPVELQREFLECHLAPWMPRFCLDIEHAARLASIRLLAGTLATLVATDRAWLAAEPDAHEKPVCAC